ncbi:MAG: LysM peptidoglycan-binding domain-containing M23 family metallopeptidase [Trueperaceae bacterium]|nr:MAG: LysM peptidoglycan-binding domain-containing M23 family metallopeptidase [Trueperaceae bacterium]
MKCRITYVFMLLFLSFPIGFASGYALKKIESGDTLGELASRYDVPLDVLMSFNDLDSVTIFPGQMIKIPYIQARGGVAAFAPNPPPLFKRHTLAAGETISGVIQRYGLTVPSLVGANPDLSSLDRLPVGIELLIPPAEGLVVTLQEEETLPDIISRYDIDPITLAKANELYSLSDVSSGMMLFLPGVKPVESLERLARVREMENRYIWPVHGRITSYFGRRNLGLGTSNFHRGIDIAAPYGTLVVASRSGTVSFAGWSSQGYGKLVKIRHPGRAETWYAHNSEILVRPGQFIDQGEVIARIGSTGISTGPHLHFEVHEGNRADDPLSFLR